MIRRNFLSLIPGSLALSLGFPKAIFADEKNVITSSNYDNRAYWVKTLARIADPVLVNLSKNTLKKNMPVEVNPVSKNDRSNSTYLEALGRLMAGLAPWLELGIDDTTEGKEREKYINLSLLSIKNAVDPNSPDCLIFSSNPYSQALVDVAFLAQSFIRAPKQLWEPLPVPTKKRVVDFIKASRAIKPGYNNWLLFTAMVEAFLMKFGEEYDNVRLDYGLKKHEEWYLGDGMYSDGPNFHLDYYNSYVIHPMLLDIAKVMLDSKKMSQEEYNKIVQRAVRYSEFQEAMISPEGTFPVIGRSKSYRFSAFQTLGMVSLIKKLPIDIKPAQVRSALSLVIGRIMEAPGTYDKNGWLQIGFAGHQPKIADKYISTGSLYMVSMGFLPLGLPATDEFWSAPATDWSSKKVYNGEDFIQSINH
jgi:hypothetical protein